LDAGCLPRDLAIPDDLSTRAQVEAERRRKGLFGVASLVVLLTAAVFVGIWFQSGGGESVYAPGPTKACLEAERQHVRSSEGAFVTRELDTSLVRLLFFESAAKAKDFNDLQSEPYLRHRNVLVGGETKRAEKSAAGCLRKK
jgi:hypothetical protein